MTDQKKTDRELLIDLGRAQSDIKTQLDRNTMLVLELLSPKKGSPVTEVEMLQKLEELTRYQAEMEETDKRHRFAVAAIKDRAKAVYLEECAAKSEADRQAADAPA